MSSPHIRRNFYSYKMPFGSVTIQSSGNVVTGLSLGITEYVGEHAPSQTTNECANQLLEYLSGKRSVFTIEHVAQGTDFQRRVWSEIEKIPYSHVITSKELAESLAMPNAYRQVGSAVRANPIAVLIPAHRVIPQNGYIGKNDHDRIRAAFRELEKRYG